METPVESAFLTLFFPHDSARGIECIRSLDSSLIAEFTLKDFNAKELGEELAITALCDIAVDVPFADDELEVRQRLVSKALGLLAEILGVGPDHELSADEAALIQHALLVDGKTVEQACALFSRGRQ